MAPPPSGNKDKKKTPTNTPPPVPPPPPVQDYRKDSYKKYAADRISDSPTANQNVSINPDNLVSGNGQVAIRGRGGTEIQYTSQPVLTPEMEYAADSTPAQRQALQTNRFAASLRGEIKPADALSGNVKSVQNANVSGRLYSRLIRESNNPMSIRDDIPYTLRGQEISLSNRNIFNINTPNAYNGSNNLGLSSGVYSRNDTGLTGIGPSGLSVLQDGQATNSLLGRTTGTLESRKSPAWYDLQGQKIRLDEVYQTRGTPPVAKYSALGGAFVVGGLYGAQQVGTQVFGVGKAVLYDFPKFALFGNDRLGAVKALPSKARQTYDEAFVAGYRIRQNIENPTPGFLGEQVGVQASGYGLGVAAEASYAKYADVRSKFSLGKFQSTNIQVDTYNPPRTTNKGVSSAFDIEVFGKKSSNPTGFNLEAQRITLPGERSISVGRGVSRKGNVINVVQVGESQFTTLKSRGLLNDYYARITTDLPSGKSNVRYSRVNRVTNTEKILSNDPFLNTDILKFTEPTMTAKSPVRSFQGFAAAQEVVETASVSKGIRAVDTKIRIAGLSQSRTITRTSVEAVRFGGGYSSTPTGKTVFVEEPIFLFVDDVPELPRASKVVSADSINLYEPTQRYLSQATTQRSRSIIAIGTKAGVNIPKIRLGNSQSEKGLFKVKFSNTPNEAPVFRLKIGQSSNAQPVVLTDNIVAQTYSVPRPQPNIMNLGLKQIALPLQESGGLNYGRPIFTPAYSTNNRQKNTPNQEPQISFSPDTKNDLEVRSLMVTRPQSQIKNPSRPLQDPFTTPARVVRPTTGQTPRTETTPRLIVLQTPQTDLTSMITPRPTPRTPSPRVPEFPSPNVPPIVPGWRFNSLDSVKGSYGGVNSLGQFKYTPSFGALVFGIRGKANKGKFSKSGLDFRPITKGFNLFGNSNYFKGGLSA